jgi:outer membrane phospholipase A
LISQDQDQTQPYTVTLPDNLVVAASAEMIAPVQLQLQREARSPTQLTLQPGEFRKIVYSALLPSYLRGMVRIETIGIDAAPVLVTVIRPAGDKPLAHVPNVIDHDSRSDSSALTPGIGTTPTASLSTTDGLINVTRLSFNEPMYFAVGNGGGATNAKFQLSFRFHIFQPDDMRSHSLTDNLYFGYTQFSLWDLHGPSAPFRDTDYRPSLYYFLPDLGIRNALLNRVSFAAGLEHESNGRDGSASRSLNTYFVKPTFSFGEINHTQLRITPKLYAYLGSLHDNPDLAQYRGHMDLNIALGQADGIEFSTTLRKGTRSSHGSADSMLTYPLSQLLPGSAGYLMMSLFYGDGESLLTYNQKLTPQLRLGYSLWR